MENRLITVDGSIDNTSIMHIKVSGSGAHNDLCEYNEKIALFSDSLDRKYNETVADFKKGKLDSSFSFLQLRKYHIKLIGQFTKEWIYSHPNSYLSPWLIMKSKELRDQKKEIYDKLVPVVKNSTYGWELREQILSEEKCFQRRTLLMQKVVY